MKKKKLVILILTLLIIPIIFFLTKGSNEKQVTVTFDTDGGTNIASVNIKKGEKITLPEEPYKEGYDFYQWLVDDKEFNFDEKIKNDITIKATQKAKENPTHPDATEEPVKPVENNKYRVTFKLNNGTKNVIKDVIKNKTVAKISDPTRYGYKFKGWYLNNKAFNFKTKITKNITLEANWEKLPDTVSSSKQNSESSSSKAISSSQATSSSKITSSSQVSSSSNYTYSSSGLSYSSNYNPDIYPTHIICSINDQSVTNYDMAVGERVKVKISFFPENTTVTSLTNTSTNNSVALINSYNNILAISSGTTTIKFETKNKKNCSINVNVE